MLSSGSISSGCDHVTNMACCKTQLGHPAATADVATSAAQYGHVVSTGRLPAAAWPDILIHVENSYSRQEQYSNLLATFSGDNRHASKQLPTADRRACTRSKVTHHSDIELCQRSAWGQQTAHADHCTDTQHPIITINTGSV